MAKLGDTMFLAKLSQYVFHGDLYKKIIKYSSNWESNKLNEYPAFTWKGISLKNLMCFVYYS